MGDGSIISNLLNIFNNIIFADKPIPFNFVQALLLKRPKDKQTMKQILTTLLIILISSYIVQSQQRGRGQMPEGDATLAGRIVDAETGNGVEFANVALFSVKDSSLVTGGTTNKHGDFRISKVPYGRYRLVADFIGYKRWEQNGVMVTPREEVTLVEDIQLKKTTIQLEGAEVVADRATYQYKIDKKVVSVEQDINSAGGTAADVLENTPSVDVDIEGNVSLRGSSSFTVLVNGRPSVLEGSDALQQIPAAQIKEIEIITNPSAKYDPEGTAGIINVVMKKQEDRGINGVANVSVGTNDKYRADILLNYRTPKYNLYGGFDYRDDNYQGDRDSYREVTLGDTTNVLDGTGTRNMSRGGTSGKVGIDYYLGSKTTIGAYARLGTWEFSRGGGVEYHEYTQPANGDYYYITEVSSPRNRDYYNFNLNFQHKFAPKDHTLDFMIDYRNSSGGSDEYTREWISTGTFSTQGEPYYQTTAQEGQESGDWLLKLDYVRPFLGGELELGWLSELEDEIETYDYQELDPVAGWINNPLFSSEMDYVRDIHAGYFTFGSQFKDFGFQIGLRGEYTYRMVTDESQDAEYPLDRVDWFPTIHLSQQLGNNYQLQASYTKRINRPRGWRLEPFLNYIDKDNLRKGNPELQPEYVDSYELSGMKKWGMTFVSLEAYYRQTDNMITRLLTPQEDGVVLHTFENINQDHALGLEAMLNYEVNEWLSFNLNGSVYDYRLEGEVSGEDVDRRSTNWRSRLNTDIKFSRKTRLQFNGGYYGPSVTAQGRAEGMFVSSLALRHDFLKGKMTAIGRIRDIFGTMRHEFTAESPGFYEHTIMQRESQVVYLTLTYRINDYKQKRENGGGDGGMNGGGYEY